jgi:hypothetical protein
MLNGVIVFGRTMSSASFDRNSEGTLRSTYASFGQSGNRKDVVLRKCYAGGVDGWIQAGSWEFTKGRAVQADIYYLSCTTQMILPDL